MDNNSGILFLDRNNSPDFSFGRPVRRPVWGKIFWLVWYDRQSNRNNIPGVRAYG